MMIAVAHLWLIFCLSDGLQKISCPKKRKETKQVSWVLWFHWEELLVRVVASSTSSGSRGLCSLRFLGSTLVEKNKKKETRSKKKRKMCIKSMKVNSFTNLKNVDKHGRKERSMPYRAVRMTKESTACCKLFYFFHQKKCCKIKVLKMGKMKHWH